jgi:hypothetical protein
VRLISPPEGGAICSVPRDSESDPDFVEGFLKGALEVWKDVKDDVFEDS